MNRGNYAFTDGGGNAHVNTGGQYSIPAVGETLMVPDVEHNDGSGGIVNSRWRRFFITAVVESTLQNDHDATVQNTYELTVDGFVPQPMVATVTRDITNELPRTHVIHTTKRSPFDPCVHYNLSVIVRV